MKLPQCQFNFTKNMKRRKFLHFHTVWIWASYLLGIECHYFTVGHTISSLWMRPATLWLPLHISESNDGFDNLCFYQKENYMLLCQLIIMMVKDTNSFVLRYIKYMNDSLVLSFILPIFFSKKRKKNAIYIQSFVT